MSTKCPFRPRVNGGWSVGAGAIVGMGFDEGPLAFSGLRERLVVRPRVRAGGRLVVAPSVEATLAVRLARAARGRRSNMRGKPRVTFLG